MANRYSYREHTFRKTPQSDYNPWMVYKVEHEDGKYGTFVGATLQTVVSVKKLYAEAVKSNKSDKEIEASGLNLELVAAIRDNGSLKGFSFKGLFATRVTVRADDQDGKEGSVAYLVRIFHATELSDIK